MSACPRDCGKRVRLSDTDKGKSIAGERDRRDVAYLYWDTLQVCCIGCHDVMLLRKMVSHSR